jgi:hypothetical protein
MPNTGIEENGLKTRINRKKKEINLIEETKDRKS